MRYLAYGGGTNSAAELCGWVEKQLVTREPIDAIGFANTGGERPHTYDHINLMSEFCVKHGLPPITRLAKWITPSRGREETLYAQAVRLTVLPAVAYGRKTCSQVFKIGPQNVWLNNHPVARETWARGDLVEKLVGYDFSETKRWMKERIPDGKYRLRFPLVEWEWDREACIAAIKRFGLPLPGKSSCFFCPSMTKPEIQEQARTYPLLHAKALTMEAIALASPKKKKKGPKGLGRRFAWKDVDTTTEEPIIEHCTEVCHER